MLQRRSTDTDAITEAADALRAGGLVILPTDTVYGLAADAAQPIALAALFEAKGRPQYRPLPSLVADPDAASALLAPGGFDDRARRLADACWPGALTLVLPAHAESSPLLTGGSGFLGLRVPDHPFTLALLRELGRPLATPSANLSGSPAPLRAEDAVAELGAHARLLVDDGPCRAGIESTLVRLNPDSWDLLRQGAISEATLRELLGTPPRTRPQPPVGQGALLIALPMLRVARRLEDLPRPVADEPPRWLLRLEQGPTPRAWARTLTAPPDLPGARGLLSLLRESQRWSGPLDVVLGDAVPSEQEASILERLLRYRDPESAG